MTALARSPFATTETRAADRAAKRDALLHAAVRMFNDRGFHATSLDDVAASLGVTKPVIYHHLGNKDRVLFECVSVGLGQLLDAADDARAGPGTGLDRLKAFLRRYAELMMEDFGACVIRTGEEALVPETRARFRELKAGIDRAMRGLIQDAADDGSAVVDDVRLTAFTFAGALNWPARWYRADGPLPASEVARRIVDILCAGLAPARA